MAVVKTRQISQLVKDTTDFVFDFDGTLVDSNQIKLNAFNICFKEYTEQIDEIIAYCHSNHHITRDKKFRHVFEEILKHPYTPEIEKKMMGTYTAVTTKAVIEANEIPGAEKFIQLLKAQGRKLYLLSSTPQQFFDPIIDGRGWRAYFKQVQGAPVVKKVWLKELASRLGCAAEKILFFGDTFEDFQSSQAAGTTFVGVVNTKLSSETSFFIHNFKEISGELT